MKRVQLPSKASVGLGNVDNTSDTNKPVSTATQTALNAKASLADPLLLGSAFSVPPTMTDPSARAMNAANEAIYIRCLGAGTFSSVALRVVSQSGNICVGVYADSVTGGVHTPGSRVATTGSVACPATGTATPIALDTSATVTHGSHWFSFVADNVTATFVVNLLFPILDSVLYPSAGYVQTSAFPLPSTATPGSGGLRRIPLIRGV